MKSNPRAPQSTAVFLALLMLVPLVPVGAADHTDETSPALPTLPHAEPGAQCVQMTNVPATALALAEDVEDGSFFAQDTHGVPLLCTLDGRPVREYAALIRETDAILENYRNLTIDLQRQVDARLEATLPEGDIVRPRFTILDDSFGDHRVGGFGNWTVVTERGEDAAWQLQQETTINGTEGAYRFGDEDGYARGVHQWLVSPEIDLTALSYDPTVVEAVVFAKNQARNSLFSFCNGLQQQGEPLKPYCGEDAEALAAQLGVPGVIDTRLSQIVRAYEAAIDEHTAALPLMQEAAVLDVTYSMNFARGEDGVRVWLYSGERAPGRTTLYHPQFGKDSLVTFCETDRTSGTRGVQLTTTTDDTPAEAVECRQTLQGGHILTGLPGAEDTAAFRETHRNANGERIALTGERAEETTVRINLTGYAGQRLWILLEAVTRPDLDGSSFFDDRSRFPSQGDYGFELLSLKAMGEGYLRNFRVKDVGENLEPVPAHNEWEDNTSLVRSVVPADRTPVVVRLQNAGQYTENGTLSVTFRTKEAVGAPATGGVTTTVTVKNMTPSEVREIPIAWQFSPGEEKLYNVTATLTVEERDNLLLGDTDTYTDPDTTRVRPPNMATAQGTLGTSLTDSVDVRSQTYQFLRAVRAAAAKDPFQDAGAPIEVCNGVNDDLTCAQPVYAGEKGTPRTLLMGIRNEGVRTENATAVLTLTLDGVPQANAILDGAERDLPNLIPGEVRALQWRLNLNAAGVYTAIVTMSVGPGASQSWNVERSIYVQQSTGLICADDLAGFRECGPSFVASIPALLRGNDTTALVVDDQGTAWAATGPVDSVHGGLFTRPKDGEWSLASNLSLKALASQHNLKGPHPDFRHEGAPAGFGTIRDLLAMPDGSIWMAGDNSTVLQRTAGGTIRNMSINASHMGVDFTAIAWYNDTMWVAGDDGTLLFYNTTRTNVTIPRLTGDTLDPVHLQLPVCGEGDEIGKIVAHQPYAGTIRDLLLTEDGLFAVGDFGAIFYHDGSGDRYEWELAASDDLPSSECEGRAGDGFASSLHAAFVHDGAVYAIGDAGTVLRSGNDSSPYDFAYVQRVPAILGSAHLRHGASTHLGTLYVVADSGLVATCSACASRADAGWTIPTVPVPAIPKDGTFRTAAITAFASHAGVTLGMGEGGVVLDFAKRDAYDNAQDWTTVPSIVARDGGVIQTYPFSSTLNGLDETQAMAYRGRLLQPASASSFDEILITLRHYVPINTLSNKTAPSGYLRVLWADYPEVNLAGNTAPVLPHGSCPRDPSGGQVADRPAEGVNVGTVCHAGNTIDNELLVKDVQAWSKPTAVDGWVTETFTLRPPPGVTQLVAVDLFKEPHFRWIVDDIRVDLRLGGRTISTPLYWSGPAAYRGVWDAERTQVNAGVAAPAPQWVQAAEVYYQEVDSAWHVSTRLADRPVWVANDELFRERYNDPHDTANMPHLRGGWDTRLLSPVLDLTDAFDPVISFRHLYAFRTGGDEAVQPPTVFPADGGWLEVQWRLEGPEECPGTPAGESCGWSPFYRVTPQGGYPGINEAGYPGYNYLNGTSDTTPKTMNHTLGAEWPFGVGLGPKGGDNQFKGQSYWGRITTPNAEGVYVDVRDTSQYQEVEVRLEDQVCSKVDDKFPCLPESLAGRVVRMAWHIQTAGKMPNRDGVVSPDSTLSFNHPDSEGDRSLPGEGWYITDLKVKGTRALGIDLRATNLTFDVGYDFETIGVGPGTRVPVNITIENRGTFDVLGYTGVLHVDEVVDPVRQLTRRVATVNLGEQPPLAAGASAYHVLGWDVPPRENAPYVLTFTVTPQGIARDEDPTDNLARHATLANPLVAKTVKDFALEVRATPATGTADITRYVPAYILNTGNVDLGDFTLRRTITQLGVPTQVVDEREFTTARVVPAGVRVSLASAAEDFNPSEDLFWKAPEEARFAITLSGSTGGMVRSAEPMLVDALTTFLFDDTDGGPRGEGYRGRPCAATNQTETWCPDEAWSVQDEGFRSELSYGFGDQSRGRYPIASDPSLEGPVLEISGARSARIAFYHRYSFEPGFDGGVVEASVDGGQTWTLLNPMPDEEAGLPKGYPDEVPLAASSQLHPTGHPDDVTYAFTGDSADIPTSTDGWILSQFDLTHYADVTEIDVAYRSFGSRDLSSYALNGTNTTDPKRPELRDFYTASDWSSPMDEEPWHWMDLTRDELRAPTGDGAVWWSGSASAGDDGRRPLENLVIEIPINLADNGKVDFTKPQEQDRVVRVEWWEWTERYRKYEFYKAPGTPGVPDLDGFYSFPQLSLGAHTWRFGLPTKPVLLETDGKWFHYSADLTPNVGSAFNLSFAYTTIGVYDGASGKDPSGMTPAQRASYERTQTTDGDQLVLADYLHDRGFAIDGFRVTTYRIVNGEVQGLVELLDEASAWQARSESSCGAGESSSVLNDWKAGETDVWPCKERSKWEAPSHTGPGRNWSVQQELPPVSDNGWATVPVVDPEGYSPINPLPTGEIPRAWWSGYPGDTSKESNPYCFARKKADGASQRLAPCVVPGAESRLVTPPLDLGLVAGDKASFVFDHRYAFDEVRNTAFHHPLSSGGVVEIQVFDEQTGEWSDWKQLYPDSDPRSLVIGATSKSSGEGVPVYKRTTDAFYDKVKEPFGRARGGYPTYTVVATSTTIGVMARGDAPFEAHYDPDKRLQAQFLYSGKTSNAENTNYWEPARFDVSEYIGQKVRFGFHAYFSAYQESAAGVKLDEPDRMSNGKDAEFHDTQPNLAARDKGGWWITNVAITGDVLRAQPVLLRLRAGSDANVNEGFWQVDDIGVFGSRYGNNVALFVGDGTGNEAGVVRGGETVVPFTIRNLGDSVRRGLAVEIRDASSAVSQLVLSAAMGDGVSVPKAGNEKNGKLRIENITLAPGQTYRGAVRIAAPEEATPAATELLFELKEFNGASATPYERIYNNEIQSFLTRLLPFEVARGGEITYVDTKVEPAAPEPGDAVTLTVTARNSGFTQVDLGLTCAAETIKETKRIDHESTAPHEREVVASYPCERTGGEITLAPGAWTNLTYRATPTQAGVVVFGLEGHLIDGIDDVPLERIEATATIGGSPLLLVDGFDHRRDVEANWSTSAYPGYGRPMWSHTRGVSSPGSLVLGTNETSMASYNCDGFVCQAVSNPVDLHNFTRERVYLTFSHQDRFARHDGGHVMLQVLEDEVNPRTRTAWSEPCVLVPLGGYEDIVRGLYPTQTSTLQDPNGWFEFVRALESSNVSEGEEFSEKLFFTSPGGVPEETWRKEIVDLYNQPVPEDVHERKYVCDSDDIKGRTVRFLFNAYTGDPMGPLNRGKGHGWLIDDVSVGPLSLEIRPELQRGVLLDNTTKTFNLVVENHASHVDLVRVDYDAANSSAPGESILVPGETFTLAPNETRIIPVDVTLPRDPGLLPTNYKARITATSLLDPNAGGSTVLDITFAPRQWAELGIGVEAPRIAVQEGTETFLPITVENTGLVESVPTTIRVIDRWEGGETELPPIALPEIPSYVQSPESSRYVRELRWTPAKGSVGVHTLVFQVDPDMNGEEYTRANNRLALEVPVTELLLPDVDIGPASRLSLRDANGLPIEGARDADVTRYEITAGELATFELKVRNTGRAGATNVDVRAFIGSLSLPPKTIPYIAPGGEVPLTFNWLAQKGEYDLSFKVLMEQLELSTANNLNPSVGRTILTVKGFEIAVELPQLPGILEPGAEIQVPFNISNTGNAGEDLDFRALAEGGIEVELPRDGLFLRAGETFPGVATVRIPEDAVAGEQFISIEAIARENPMKVAMARTPVDVLASYGGSMTPTVARAAPPELVIPLQLTNEGNSLEPWTVDVRLPSGWSARERLPMEVVVPARGAEIVELHVTVPETTPPGQRALYATARLPDGQTRETTLRVDIGTLRSAGVTVTAPTPKPAEGALAFPVVVENRGNVKAPFELVLLDVPAGVKAAVSPAAFDLPPGGKSIATLLVTPDATQEESVLPVTTYALFPGVNPGSREGAANFQSLQVNLQRPDLAVGELEYAPRAALSAADRVTFRVPVTNLGETATGTVPVHLYVDDSFIAETLLTNLEPGQKTEVVLNWTALPGEHAVTAVVDPYNETVDADRQDNAVSVLVDVGSGGAVGGLAAGRADAPGPGIFLSILALVGAVALLRGRGARRPPE